MKASSLFGIILVLWLVTSSFVNVPHAGKLVIEIENIKKPEGIIWVGIYNSNNYMIKEQAIVEGYDVTSTGYIRTEIPTLEYGTYAIALFHDVNGNGELDRNKIGIPNEPFAFSKKPKNKFRLPRFEEIKFEFMENDQLIKTRLRKWWE